VGVAWSGSESSLYGYVNVVVGMNAGYMAQLNEKQEKKIKEQESEINDLKKQLNMMNNALAQLVPNYSALMESGKGESTTVLTQASPPLEERTVVYYEITREQILEGISLAEKTLKEKGMELDTHPFFKKMTEDPEYKECFISDALASVKNELEKYYQDDMKSGAKVIKLTRDFE